MPTDRPLARHGAVTRLTLLTMIMVFLVGVMAARLAAMAQPGSRGFTDPIAEVYRVLSAQYVDAIDTAKLQQGAIAGLVGALDDPYAEYIAPEDAAEFSKQMTGQFSGIGCQIEMRDGWLTVVTPLEDSPAMEAGILSGDRIISVEGKSTFGLTSDECVKMLTGVPGTKVSFVVLRGGKETTYTLARRQITNKSVRGLRRSGAGNGGWEYLLDPARKVAYIRITQFTPTAPEEFGAALADARRSAGGTLGGLVLDLRGNPGGVLDAAERIADAFLDEGVIVSVRGRAMREQVIRSRRGGPATDFPVCVLVDGSSASASEILAGAIQDHNRGVVVGTRTFGKGLVQTVVPLDRQRNGHLKFTTQKYYLPSGRLIQRTDDSAIWGVDPSPGFYVPVSDDELQARFLRRRDFDAITGNGAPPPAQDWGSPDWIAREARDSQLAAALRAAQSRVDTGSWQPVSEAVPADKAIAAAELRRLERSRELLGLEFARIDKRITALESAAATGEAKPPRVDLWPDDIELDGGRVVIRDRDGNTVATLRITGQDLERWLLQADVEVEGNSR
ncbi:MAG: S41 family peptidase [Phycisphaeraceae bacterium]|nr:S41 family peptidase [Phycisphaeraceae bacterium]